MTGAEWDREYLWHFRAKLIRVVDGDTIAVLTDNGMSIRCDAHIRIRGLFEPELSTEEGQIRKEALNHYLALFVQRWEWPLRVRTEQLKQRVGEQMTFTRYVGDVWIGESMIPLDGKNEVLQGTIRKVREVKERYGS